MADLQAEIAHIEDEIAGVEKEVLPIPPSSTKISVTVSLKHSKGPIVLSGEKFEVGQTYLVDPVTATQLLHIMANA